MKVKRVGLAILLSLHLLYGQGKWQSIGPENRTIQTVFLTSKSLLLAATSERVFYKIGNSWDYIGDFSLSVKGIVERNDETLVIAAGSGTNSDGVYAAKYSPTSDPPYNFTRLTYFNFPEALCLKGDTVFVGGRNAISMIIQDSAGVTPVVQPLKMPRNVFGSDRPRCSALMHFEVAQGVSGLFAGGYERSNMVPGNGHLLQQLRDSMVIIKDWNVSAMVKGVFAPVGPLEFVVGTLDSSLYSLKSGVTPIEWTRMSSPENNPIDALAAVEGPMQGEQIVTAVDGDVFAGRAGNWTVLGNMPYDALCLCTGTRYPEIYAGTENGVYQYTEPTPIEQNITKNKITSQIISHYRVDNNQLKITLNLPEDGNVRMVLYDLSGRKLGTLFEDLVGKGKKDISASISISDTTPLGKGMYLLRIYYNGVCADRSIVNLPSSF